MKKNILLIIITVLFLSIPGCFETSNYDGSDSTITSPSFTLGNYSAVFRTIKNNADEYNLSKILPEILFEISVVDPETNDVIIIDGKISEADSTKFHIKLFLDYYDSPEKNTNILKEESEKIIEKLNEVIDGEITYETRNLYIPH